MFRALITVALLATALPAVAQPPPGGDDPGRDAMRERMRHVREVCQPDMDRLCPAAPGQDRRARHECMMANRDKLSKPCLDATLEMQAWRRDHPRPDRRPGPQDGPGPQ